jgi:hypothetical protein
MIKSLFFHPSTGRQGRRNSVDPVPTRPAALLFFAMRSASAAAYSKPRTGKPASRWIQLRGE